MTQSRRGFIAVAASAMAASAWGAVWLAAQGQGPVITLPVPGGQLPPFGDTPVPARRRSPAEQMKINREEIQKDMARLKATVGELEKEFDAKDTTAVLSMDAVRKTEEIEKLARHIRGLVHG